MRIILKANDVAKPLITLSGRTGYGASFRVITGGVSVYVSDDRRALDAAAVGKDGMRMQSADPPVSYQHFSDDLYGRCANNCEMEILVFDSGLAKNEGSPWQPQRGIGLFTRLRDFFYD